MSKSSEQLTSVSVDSASFSEFRKESAGTGTNLKKLVEFSLKLYAADPNFRKRVNSHTPGGSISV